MPRPPRTRGQRRSVQVAGNCKFCRGWISWAILLRQRLSHLACRPLWVLDKRVLSRVRTRSKEARFALPRNVHSLPFRHCAAATRRTSAVDPELTFLIGPVNRRRAHESSLFARTRGLRIRAIVCPPTGGLRSGARTHQFQWQTSGSESCGLQFGPWAGKGRSRAVAVRQTEVQPTVKLRQSRLQFSNLGRDKHIRRADGPLRRSA